MPTLPRYTRYAPLITAVVVILLSGGLVACSSDDDGGSTPRTTGTIAGSVLDNRTDAPIVGAAVSLENLAAPKRTRDTTRTPGANKQGPMVQTDAAGGFRFNDVEPGSYEIVIDARGVLPTGVPSIHYVEFRIHASVAAGQDVALEQAVYLPRIDDNNATLVEEASAATVAPASIPGLSMEITAGGATFPNGSKSGSVAIVDIPIDRAPMTMPDGMAPALLISIQPAGTSFDPPAPISFPNAEGMPAGAELDILSMDPDDGEFILAARGKVSPDGLSIDSMAGTGDGGITRASWHAPICDAHTIIGRILDSFDGPVAGAVVEVLSGVNTSTGQAVIVPGGSGTSGSDGRFTINGIRVCNITVKATLSSSAGTGTAQSFVPVQRDGSGVTDIGDLVMTINTSLVSYNCEGRVRLNGSPVSGAFISWSGGEFKLLTPEEAQNLDPQRDPFGTTDSQGRYRLENLAGAASSSFTIFGEYSGQNEQEYAFGSVQGTAPNLAGNGSTITGLDIDLMDYEVPR